MSVSVSGAENKQPHPSVSPGREAACRNSSVLGLIPLPYPPALCRTGTRRGMDREENEEHLHLNGKFFFPSSLPLYLFGNDLVMFGSRHERKSFYLLVASVLNRNLQLNTPYSCLFFVLCCFILNLLDPHTHYMLLVILPLLGVRRCVCMCDMENQSSCPRFTQRSCKTPSHLTFTGLCNLRALENITTLAP